MVLILDSISEIGAHGLSGLGYLICLRHLVRTRSVTNLIFISEKTYITSLLSSNVSTMYKTIIPPPSHPTNLNKPDIKHKACEACVIYWKTIARTNILASLYKMREEEKIKERDRERERSKYGS